MRPFPDYDISPNTPEAYEEHLNDSERDEEEEPEDDDKRTLTRLVGLIFIVFGGFNALAASTPHTAQVIKTPKVSLQVEWVKFDPTDRTVCTDVSKKVLRSACGHFRIL